jgi:DNA repair protein RadA/Sms
MKTKTVFVCQNCGTQSARWVGKCPNCEEWNTYVEEALAERREPMGTRVQIAAEVAAAPVLLKEVDVYQDKRTLTAIGEFDRVMGGGIVAGSVTLIGGDPGIGKSTMVLQAGCALARAGLKVLYVSGEESVKQAKMRADRVAQSANDNFFIVKNFDNIFFVISIQCTSVMPIQCTGKIRMINPTNSTVYAMISRKLAKKKRNNRAGACRG